MGKPILSYHESEVEGYDPQQMYIRCSTQKSKQDINRKLIVFILHGKMLYSWTQMVPGFDNIEHPENCKPIRVN